MKKILIDIILTGLALFGMWLSFLFVSWLESEYGGDSFLTPLEIVLIIYITMSIVKEVKHSTRLNKLETKLKELKGDNL